MRALPSLAFAAILACAALPARADYMIGFEAFRIEEYGVAHSELLPAAEAGDGGAAIILALLYANGYGRPADRADRKSTRLNSSHSQQSRMPSSA